VLVGLGELAEEMILHLSIASGVNNLCCWCIERPSLSHPFWVRNDSAKGGNWIGAAKIRSGDMVLSVGGSWRKVLSIAPLPGRQAAYNFEVDGNHDYFVGVSGILVHNDLCLWKFDQQSGTAYDTGVGVQEGNYNMFLPDQGDSLANRAQNEAQLSSEMEEGDPIWDTYRDPVSGQLLDVSDDSFLGMERAFLEANGWTYEGNIGAWLPPWW
jgi:hypothetical protein